MHLNYSQRFLHRLNPSWFVYLLAKWTRICVLCTRGDRFPGVFGSYFRENAAYRWPRDIWASQQCLNLKCSHGKELTFEDSTKSLTSNCWSWAKVTRRNHKRQMLRSSKIPSWKIQHERREEKTSSCVHEFDEYRSLIGGAQVQQTARLGEENASITNRCSWWLNCYECRTNSSFRKYFW